MHLIGVGAKNQDLLHSYFLIHLWKHFYFNFHTNLRILFPTLLHFYLKCQHARFQLNYRVRSRWRLLCHSPSICSQLRVRRTRVPSFPPQVFDPATIYNIRLVTHRFIKFNFNKKKKKHWGWSKFSFNLYKYIFISHVQVWFYCIQRQNKITFTYNSTTETKSFSCSSQLF